jgi:hypothetical protein
MGCWSNIGGVANASQPPTGAKLKCPSSVWRSTSQRNWSSAPPARCASPLTIAAESEFLAAAATGEASDIMMEDPLALQLRNLQTLIEIGVDKNTTVVFPGPLMSTIQELGAFLTRETDAVAKMAKPAVGDDSFRKSESGASRRERRVLARLTSKALRASRAMGRDAQETRTSLAVARSD